MYETVNAQSSGNLETFYSYKPVGTPASIFEVPRNQEVEVIQTKASVRKNPEDLEGRVF